MSCSKAYAGALLAALGIALGSSGCGPARHHEAYPSGEHEEEAGHEEESGSDLSHGSDPEGAHGRGTGIVEGLLTTVPSIPVEGVDGVEDGEFRVALRTPEIGYFPCTDCHVRPIGGKSLALEQMHASRASQFNATGVNCYHCHSTADPTALVLECTECHEREEQRELMPTRTVHLTVELGHPTGYYRNCLTCHAPENPGLLSMPDGARATLDHAYRLCSWCHFDQAVDWAGGAHGKRYAGWEGQRVVRSCTGCHDPHDPSFAARRPVTFPKLPRRGDKR